MADNIFTTAGGKVQYIPGKVESHIDPYQYTNEDQIKQLALQRDLTAANLLENDILLDMLDAAIDDQMKNFALNAPEIAKQAQALCGSPIVTWECYKKAKELLQIAPWITNGFDPVQLTFTDKFVPRSGNVVMNCQNYDPDTFPDPSAGINSALGLGDPTLDPSTVQAAAQDNQKKWALLMLFWDLLWGKPGVKPNLPDSDTSQALDTDAITTQINTLTAQSQDPTKTPAQQAIAKSQAQVLAQQISSGQQLPDTIMKDRPTVWTDLQWQGASGNPLDNVLKSGQEEIKVNATDSTPWVDDAIAVWLDFFSLLSLSADHYKNKSIPVMKSGFILPILMGICSLVPKITFFFIEARQKLLNAIKIVKKIPLVGTAIYKLIQTIINYIVAIPVGIGNVFLELCIWLAMHPVPYYHNVSDSVPLPQTSIGLNTGMVPNPTPAGFISMDCLTNAQDIVNRVNQEAISG